MLKNLYYPSGMSKRFYAACAAMQGLLSGYYSNPDMMKILDKDSMEEKMALSTFIVDQSYYIADELLRQENE